MRFWIEYTFEDGAVYRDPQDLHWMEGDEPEGEWTRPFPNRAGDSFAHGATESLTQSAIGDVLIGEHGVVVAVKTWRWS
jgi:hypothetical protein